MRTVFRSGLPIIVGCSTAIAAFAVLHGCDPMQYDPASFASVTVTPQHAKSAFGGTVQFTATGQLRDGSVADATNLVAWSSSNTAAATIDPATGLATAGDTAATITITASIDGVSGGATLEVLDLPLQSIAVSPASATLKMKEYRQFTATGTYSDGTTTLTQDITSAATWTSSNGSIASVDATGYATGVAPGTVTITAAKSSKSGTAHVTVTNETAATITGIAVTPTSVKVKQGGKQPFKATATYSDGSTNDVTSTGEVLWTSSNTSDATVDSSGLASVPQTAVPTHTVDIVATARNDSSVSGKGTITVQCPSPTVCGY